MHHRMQWCVYKAEFWPSIIFCHLLLITLVECSTHFHFLRWGKLIWASLKIKCFPFIWMGWGVGMMGGWNYVVLTYPYPTHTNYKHFLFRLLFMWIKKWWSTLLVMYTVDNIHFFCKHVHSWHWFVNFIFDMYLIYIFPHTGSSQGTPRNVHSQKNGESFFC